MEATELRIGSWIHIYTADANDDRRVSDIHGWKISCGLRDADIEEVSGIELTEEWLLKFGFKKDSMIGFWKDEVTHYFDIMKSNGEWYPSWVMLPELSHEEEKRSTINSLKYVHQLQNLYFALTGKEL